MKQININSKAKQEFIAVFTDNTKYSSLYVSGL